MLITASISLHSTENRGRKSPIFFGYRPTFGMEKENSDCVILTTTEQGIFPGKSAVVDIDILHPHLLTNLKVGEAFKLLEGMKEIGTGIILSDI